jgi:hypothetical protein
MKKEQKVCNKHRIFCPCCGKKGIRDKNGKETYEGEENAKNEQ